MGAAGHLGTQPRPRRRGACLGSSRQAPGQLVAISSVDYLVAMPSGVRALEPSSHGIPCLLACRAFWAECM